jgi:hypothetical protein
LIIVELDDVIETYKPTDPDRKEVDIYRKKQDMNVKRLRK